MICKMCGKDLDVPYPYCPDCMPDDYFEKETYKGLLFQDSKYNKMHRGKKFLYDFCWDVVVIMGNSVHDKGRWDQEAEFKTAFKIAWDVYIKKRK